MTSKVSLVVSFILFFLFLLPFSSHARLLNSSNGEKPSPFEFIKDLQGCHKGDNAKGIHKLKKYLQQFGYLTYSHSKNHTHANDNDFDEILESAIKTYQTNYHLKATGNLDAETVSEMTKPRCGVADIINGTNWMRSENKRHDDHHSHSHGHGSLHKVNHYEFLPGNPRWPSSKTSLTYAFLPGTQATAMAPVDRAFADWASVSHFRFTRTEDHRNADMTVSFHRRNHGDGSPFDGRGGVIAHAFPPTNGRFHYDADEPFAVGAVRGAFDLQTVALHEIGHLLGLGHSEERDAIMFASIAPGVTKGLHGDDIRGIKALYSRN